MDTATMITDCSIRFRDPTFQVRSRARWLTHLNKVYRKFVKQARFPMPVAFTDLAFAAGDASKALPADVWRVESAYNMTDDALMTPLYSRPQQGALYPPTEPNGYARNYTIEGSNLYVFEVPRSATTVRVLYPQPLTDLADNGGSVPVFPAHYHHALEDGALALAFRDDQNPELAQMYQTDMDEAVRDALAEFARPRLGRNIPVRNDYFDTGITPGAGWRR